MLGALARDIIGSVCEGLPTKSVDFPLFQEASRFTDDSVMTIAVSCSESADRTGGETDSRRGVRSSIWLRRGTRTTIRRCLTKTR
jgi:ADP-ribosylglycohydrolase